MQDIFHIGIGLPAVDIVEEMTAAQQHQVGKPAFLADKRKGKLQSVLMDGQPDRIRFAEFFQAGPVPGDDLVLIEYFGYEYGACDASCH